MVQVSASYDPPRLRYNIISTLSVNNAYCIVQSTTDHPELVRVPKPSSVLLFIACTDIAHMLFESVRMSVKYLSLSLRFCCKITRNTLQYFSETSSFWLMNYSLPAPIYPIVDFEVVDTLIFNGLSGFALKKL